MARRNNRISIAASPATTDIFKATLGPPANPKYGGPDGTTFEIAQIECAPDSAVALEYRVNDSYGFGSYSTGGDPAGEWARLAIGASVILRLPSGVDRTTCGFLSIIARGVGGIATGGIQVLQG